MLEERRIGEFGYLPGTCHTPRGSRAQPPRAHASRVRHDMEITMANEPLHIVLTGASRGLGLAMAEGFIASGHVVAGCTRSSEATERLGSRWPAPHRFDAVDVADDAAVAGWAKSVLKEL